MLVQGRLFIQPPLVVWKVQASAAAQNPAVHKHINTARAHDAALLIDRNPKFLQWKCLCSPSAATQWARLSGVGWRHCKRRPSLIPCIAQRRHWPWQEAIKIVPLPNTHVYSYLGTWKKKRKKKKTPRNLTLACSKTCFINSFWLKIKREDRHKLLHWRLDLSACLSRVCFPLSIIPYHIHVLTLELQYEMIFYLGSSTNH